MTRRTLFAIVAVATWCVGSTMSFAQQQTAPMAGAQFDVVSIKPHRYDPATGGGMRMGQGTIEATGITLDRLVPSLSGLAGGRVNNRTGLDGAFDLTLHFAPDPSAPIDDAPQFLTALQEQLGLKLVPEKSMVKIFVIDHIERPTPN